MAGGWYSAGEYFSLDYGSNNNKLNSNGIISKHWLVGSCNPNLYNFFSNNSNQNYEFNNFKLQNVTVSTKNIIVRAKKIVENRLFRANDANSSNL